MLPFNFGLPELIIILVIVLLIFGASRLPELGSGLGRMIREFRKASEEDSTPPEAAGRNQVGR